MELKKNVNLKSNWLILLPCQNSKYLCKDLHSGKRIFPQKKVRLCPHMDS